MLSQSSMRIGAAVLSVITLPIVYSISGLISGIIGAFIYNFIAGAIGGIEIELGKGKSED